MDAFDDEHGVAGELELLAVVLALACGEVVLRHLYALALHETCEMLLHETIVDGLDIVEVIVAVGQLGGVDTVDEIVVGGEGHGPQAAGEELDAESLAEGGLA